MGPQAIGGAPTGTRRTLVSPGAWLKAFIFCYVFIYYILSLYFVIYLLYFVIYLLYFVIYLLYFVIHLFIIFCYLFIYLFILYFVQCLLRENIAT